ncbi:hypothetical protein B0H14DRAFT_3743302 [Mycena olivaceomarginata]|nr:hypothetical protein B0H14DRAFT_3743302 [Mycena olivaceomarginata]
MSSDKKFSVLAVTSELLRSRSILSTDDRATANTGLGYEIVKALYATSIPYELVIGSRTLSKADDAIKVLQSEVASSSSTLSTLQVDVSSDASLEAAVKTLEGRYGRLDILINNVGAGFDAAVQAGTMSDINVSSTHVLTTLAVPFLLKSADPRLLFITSGTSSIAETDPATWDNMPHLSRTNQSPPKGWPKPQKFVPFLSYRSAKVGLNILMREWVRTLKEDGVKILFNAIHERCVSVFYSTQEI